MNDRGLTIDPLGVNADGELLYTVGMGARSTLRLHAGAILVTAGLTLLQWGCRTVPEFARDGTLDIIRGSVGEEEPCT